MKKSVVHDYSAGVSKHSQVYTLDMPIFVYVQVHGVDKPARIRADKVEDSSDDLVHGIITLKRGSELVGQFKTSAVQGWWIEDEPK